MRLQLMAWIGLSAAIASPALAQDELSSRPAIVVMGEGQAEAQPDTFRVTADLEGRGATQVQALRELSEAHDRVGAIAVLEGLDRARLTTSNPQITPTRDPSCGGRDYGDGREDCPITGYVARMGLVLEGAPIARAGDAVSLAAERGARNAAVSDVFLADDAALRAEANRAAFADARRQADTLAQASGQRIVRMLRLQDPGVRAFDAPRADVQEFVVTGSRIRPTVSLDLAPPPVRVAARLAAVFEIE